MNTDYIRTLIKDLYSAGMHATGEDMGDMLTEIERLLKENEKQKNALTQVYSLVLEEESAKAEIIKATILSAIGDMK